MTARIRRARTVGIAGIAGIGVLGIAAAALASAAVAVADVNEMAPGPEVHSRQASVSSYQGVRVNSPNVARGQSETRLAGAGVIEAQGEVRDSAKAVPGSAAGAFQGPWPIGAPMGDF